MKHTGSLRRRFFTFIVAVYAITSVLAAAAFYVVTVRTVRPLAREQVSLRAELERSKVTALIDREVALTLKLADDPLVIRWAQHRGQGPEADAAQKQLESYRSVFRDRSFFVALTKDLSYQVHDERRGWHERTLSPEDTADRWFFRTLETVDTVDLNVDHNAALGTTKVWINAVMKDPEGHKIGLAGTGIDISDFLREVTKSNASGVRAILVDRNGAITAHEKTAYVQHNANVLDDSKKMSIYALIRNPAQAAELARTIDQLDAGKPTSDTLELDIEGVTYVAAVRRIGGVGWFDIVLFDTSKLVSPSDFLAPVAIFVVSLVVLLALMSLLLERIVLTPLEQLTQASVAFASGEKQLTVSTSGRDEIGALADAFKKMTFVIADQTENLERRVDSRTAELATANLQIEHSRKQIVDSIEYAKMIQSSLLPHEQELDAFFPDWFVLYRPRDIVGGDLYWFRQLSPHVAAVALIDCVGHGVPGAFMTMMVKAILDQVASEGADQQPGALLSELNRRLRETLRQDDGASGGIDSGAEIGLCICDHGAGRVWFAGAGISLAVVGGTSLRHVAGDRQRVGYRRSRAEHRYTTHEIVENIEQRYYLTTDGILDQAGGRGGYGWGRRRFHETLSVLRGVPLRGQEERIESVLNEYRQSRTQVDDIAVLGFALVPRRNDPFHG